MNTKKLKKLGQLTNTKNLYDCQIRCLSAVTFILKNNIEDPQQIQTLFEETKSCIHPSIRDFIHEILPSISNFCVPHDLPDRIKHLQIQMANKKDPT